MLQENGVVKNISMEKQPKHHQSISTLEDASGHWKPYKGVIRSLQKTGCAHVLDLYCQGLTFRDDHVQHDLEFMELQVYLLTPNIFFLVFCLVITLCHYIINTTKCC